MLPPSSSPLALVLNTGLRLVSQSTHPRAPLRDLLDAVKDMVVEDKVLNPNPTQMYDTPTAVFFFFFFFYDDDVHVYFLVVGVDDGVVFVVLVCWLWSTFSLEHRTHTCSRYTVWNVLCPYAFRCFRFWG